MDIKNTDNILKVISTLLINKTFRWILFGLLIILTVSSYIQEPIRFSGKFIFGRITYKIYYFVLICITLFIYIFNFLGLEFTIPFSRNFPIYWYIPVILILYAIILDITINSKIATNNKGNLEPPPKYLLPKQYR